MEPHHPNSRRTFIKNVSLSVGASMIAFPMIGGTHEEQFPTPELKPLTAPPIEKKGKLGIALVGLGQYSTHQLAPALEQTKNVYLAGIVTGTPSKKKAWQKRYNLPEENCYTYDNFDEIVNNKDIDIVYVVLPNSMHAEFTIRAAKAKKHVICEKPMATTVADAKKMLEACRANNVLLAIGYRLHYEPFHQHVMDLGQNKKFGKVESLAAANGTDNTEQSVDMWRLDRERAGGGSLMDMGIYCIQGICYSVGKQPVAVSASYIPNEHPTVFHDIEQGIRWKMYFDDGVVGDCETSYAKDQSELSGKAKNGWWKLDPSYGYDGKKGTTSEGPMQFPEVYEQVFQMDAQAADFRQGKTPKTSGEMGLRDMHIIEAIYESANNGGKKVNVKY